MKKSISFIMLLCLCISNAFPGNLLAPPASNISLFERQSIIIDERERNRVIETFDKYISKVEYMTHVRYLLYRFFFEDIVGISFRELTLEDFISEAKILLLEYINRHPQSAVFPVQHVESNIITMCDAMAARHYALDAQEFIFWISRLKDAISTPSKKTLRERIILYRETLIALMARNKKDRIRLSEFISDSRKNNLLYTEADIGKSIPDFHHADPQDLARIDEFMHVLMGRFKKLSYNQKTVFSFGLGTEGPHLELKKSIAQFLNITVNRVAQTETFVRYELYQYFQHKLSKLLNTFDSENKDIPGQFKSERIKTFKRMMENQTPDEKNKNGNKFALFPYVHDTAPLVEWEKEDTPLREDPLTDQEEQEIMQWIKTELTIDQQLMLPLILQGASNNKIADQLHVTKKRVLYVKEKLLKKLRICFTIGYFNQYGSWEQVAEVMTQLLKETTLQQIFRKAHIAQLLLASKGNRECIKDLLLQLYPDLFKEEDIDNVLNNNYIALAESVHQGAAHKVSTPRSIIEQIQRLVYELGESEQHKRVIILRRLLRDLIYPIMRHDEETHTVDGLANLGREKVKFASDPIWGDPVAYAYDFYRKARPFHPRGYAPLNDGHKEPLLPYHRYGIWEALQSLHNPQERCALFTSEARIGKMIMALLTALNIRHDGNYVARRILYTTTNQAKYEVADEIRRRIDKKLKFKVIVVDQEEGGRVEQIQNACKTRGNVILIANYESVRDCHEEVREFKPDVHIIDEIENLRRGNKTIRAPLIYGIPAPYRIGISARMVVKEGRDIAEALSWARRKKYPDAHGLRKYEPADFFVALEPVSVRWRRSVVLPELGDPVYHTITVPYSVLQDKVVHSMRDDFLTWKQKDAREDKRNRTDHLFSRFELERRASVDLSLVIDGADMTAQSPKIKKLTKIIRQEQKNNGKVVVLVDFIEEIDTLEKHYNDLFGEGAAFCVSGRKPLSSRNAGIRQFRSNKKPFILIGSSELLGFSLNLFQLPDSSFHISTLVRLSRPWLNVDDGERLIGIGQTYPVHVYTLMSKFRTQPQVLPGGRPELTIEELQEQNLARKRLVFAASIDGRSILNVESAQELESMSALVLKDIIGHMAGGNILPEPRKKESRVLILQHAVLRNP